ncbi:MAG: hypothetical protein MJY89_07015 [Bacteroidales bacterium]|nr:hypothetical protein [Bacteroidales bacterium]
MKNYKTHSLFISLVLITAVISCGPVRQAVPTMPALPDQSRADSLMLTLTGQDKSLNVALQFDERPKVFGFMPDSSGMTIFTLCPENGEWKMESNATYQCFDNNGLPFISFADSSSIRYFENKRVISFNTLHEKDTDACKSFVLYDPDSENLTTVSLLGKWIQDGKIEGSSNKNLIDGTEKPEVQWLIKAMESDPALVELSENEIKTIQALEWWENKNPGALKNASGISFGKLPPDCTLVESFNAAAKEKSSKYIAALFSVRGRNVIVAQRRATGEYMLVWVEPLKYNGRTIENYYFENDSVLSILYYQGRKSFKYRLNLTSSTLVR